MNLVTLELIGAGSSVLLGVSVLGSLVDGERWHFACVVETVVKVNEDLSLNRRRRERWKFSAHANILSCLIISEG